MRYLSRIVNLNWIRSKDSNSEVSKGDVLEQSEEHFDISVAEIEDNGGLYLIAFDGWTREDINQFNSHEFRDLWEQYIDNSGYILLAGKIGGGGDIQVVETSLNEVLHGEEDENCGQFS